MVRAADTRYRTLSRGVKKPGDFFDRGKILKRIQNAAVGSGTVGYLYPTAPHITNSSFYLFKILPNHYLPKLAASTCALLFALCFLMRFASHFVMPYVSTG